MVGSLRRVFRLRRLKAAWRLVMRPAKVPAQSPPSGAYGHYDCSQGKHQNRK